MNATQTRFLATPFLIVISSLCPRAMVPQSQMPSGLPSRIARLRDCDDAALFGTIRERDGGPARSSATGERPDTGRECSETVADERPGNARWTGNVPAPRRPSAQPAGKPERGLTADNEAALRDIGQQGTTSAGARRAVAEILEGENECSTWFRQRDPRIAATFLSLNYSVDEDGPKHVTKERNDDGIWIVHGPYIARTRQSTGPGTTITINGNGAFFRGRGDVYRIDWNGGIKLYTGKWRFIHVGPYDGGTLQAQVISLLHELGHVIGALPIDDSSQFGFARSQENTQQVLQHCKAAADKSTKRATLVLAQEPVN